MNVQSRRRDHRGEPPANVILATLVPQWAGGHYGYLYDVVLDGETIVDGSHDPGHDACRVLFSRGKVGRLTLVNRGGVPRISFDILRAAFLTVSEEDVKGLRVRRYRKGLAKGEVASRGAGRPQESGIVPATPIAAHARAVHHWERHNDYPNVALQIDADWRIIGCRDDIQWILQRRTSSAWKSIGHCRSRKGLESLLRRNGFASSLVSAFPEMYRGGGP